MAVFGIKNPLPTRDFSAFSWGCCALVAIFLAFCAPSLAGGDAPLRDTYWKFTHCPDGAAAAGGASDLRRERTALFGQRRL